MNSESRRLNWKEVGEGKAIDVYELSQQEGREAWLVCIYLNTNAVVFKPLLEKHKVGEVTYASNAISAIERQ